MGENSPEDQESVAALLTAVHEAGHALVARVLRGPGAVHSIDVRHSDALQGSSHMEFEPPARSSVADQVDALARVAAFFAAGRAAVDLTLERAHARHGPGYVIGRCPDTLQWAAVAPAEHGITVAVVTKITFLGAGSTVFAKNVLGDVMLQPSLHDAHISLYDIDRARLTDSARLIEALNQNENAGRAHISSHLGPAERPDALRDASYVVNAIQVGGYEPCTVADFEVPRRYGLRQTIGDTIGIGGLFRALRTLPVLLEITRDMEKVCPNAWLLNYTNPMCAVTAGLSIGSNVRTVGLCHSVQMCVPSVLWTLGLDERHPPGEVEWEIAGINHQAWLLRLQHGGEDLYPEVTEVARSLVARVRARGGGTWVREVLGRIGVSPEEPCYMHPFRAMHAQSKGLISEDEARDVVVACDLVRLELLFRFGYYLTESSEHTAEYTPWFIKSGRPELLDEYNIPLDEYPRRCRHQIAAWEKQRVALLEDPLVRHKPSHEFGAYIINAIETDEPYHAHGNVMNEGLITNLPAKACVEVPCLVDAKGVHPSPVGDLPEPCAALNRTQIGTQILAVEAVLEGRKDRVYQAALLDPHTSAELGVDETVALCDDLIEAHRDWLPTWATTVSVRPR